jgi:phosphoglycolate phosphatase-like HAD superfamily hydrolase
MWLLLFDIDGTLLLNASAEHAAAMHAAMDEVHGVRPEAVRVEAAGRTDGAIVRSILTLQEVAAEQIDERWPAVREAAVEAFAQLCPDSLEDRLAPGMAELLEALSRRDDIRLSLVTGNLEPIARLKLKRAGIGHLFPAGQGGFGSDSEDRADLPALARARAGAPEKPWPAERTVVIGDTPRDIACARADGVHVIAVTTGPFDAGDLAEADAVVGGAAELPAAIDGLAATPA